MKTARIFGILCPALAVACGGTGGESTGQNVSAETVDPTDSENLGYVLVRSPAAASAMSYTLALGGRAIEADKSLRLTAGTYTLSISYGGNDWSTRPETRQLAITVQKTQTTTVLLSAVRFDFSGASPSDGDLNVVPSRTLRIDASSIDPNPATSSLVCTVHKPAGYVWNCHHEVNYLGSQSQWTEGQFTSSDDCWNHCRETRDHENLSCMVDHTTPEEKTCTTVTVPAKYPDSVVANPTFTGLWSGDARTALVTFGGSFKLSLTSPDETLAKSIAPGATDTIRLMSTQHPNRGSIVINPPVSRDLPSAAATALVVAIPQPGARNKVTLDGLSPRTLTAVGFASGNGNAYLELGSRHVPITVPDGGQVTVNLKRIDVRDVTLQREDGTSYVVKGTYRVFSENDGNVDGFGNILTGFGVDVLPGRYRIELAYTTAEGPKSQTFRLAL
jgi:hypothetical protein